MDRQRIYDAMLIKAFRKDVTTGMLNYWLKPYGFQTPDPELKRQPPAFNMRVQSFVGSYLKPLADRLWDTEPTSDIKTLDWMAILNSENTARLRKQETQREAWQRKKDKATTYAVRTTLYMQCTNNQWGVTKAPTKLRRVTSK